MRCTQIAVAFIGSVHALLMLAEVFKWGEPFLMTKLLGDKWGPDIKLPNGKAALPMVVHNAGIYNGIVAAGLFATLAVGEPAFPIQVTLLAGGIVAGLFGAWTLSRITGVQAILGLIALGFVLFDRLSRTHIAP
jgi:putative membrane protein